MYNLISLTRSELRGGEGTGDLANERNLQMSVRKCVCVSQVWLIIMHDLRFSFGFNGQVHHYASEN